MMIKVALTEYYVVLIKSLRWWKLALFLMLTVTLVFIYASKEPLFFWQLYMPIWISNAIRPKVSKLNYLLPGDKCSRSLYLLGSFAGALILFLVWFGTINGINVILQNYSIEYGLKRLLGQDIIILLIMAGINLTSYIYKSGYRWQNKKSGISALVLMILFLIYPTTHLAAWNSTLTGNRYLVSLAVSYLCAIPAAYFIISSIKNLDTVYDNIRKPVKDII